MCLKRALGVAWHGMEHNTDLSLANRLHSCSEGTSTVNIKFLENIFPYSCRVSSEDDTFSRIPIHSSEIYALSIPVAVIKLIYES